MQWEEHIIRYEHERKAFLLCIQIREPISLGPAEETSFGSKSYPLVLKWFHPAPDTGTQFSKCFHKPLNSKHGLFTLQCCCALKQPTCWLWISSGPDRLRPRQTRAGPRTDLTPGSAAWDRIGLSAGGHHGDCSGQWLRLQFLELHSYPHYDWNDCQYLDQFLPILWLEWVWVLGGQGGHRLFSLAFGVYIAGFLSKNIPEATSLIEFHRVQISHCAVLCCNWTQFLRLLSCLCSAFLPLIIETNGLKAVMRECKQCHKLYCFHRVSNSSQTP